MNYECSWFEIRVSRIKYGMSWGKELKEIKRKRLAVKME